jgi:hypothetical protein
MKIRPGIDGDLDNWREKLAGESVGCSVPIHSLYVNRYGCRPGQLNVREIPS